MDCYGSKLVEPIEKLESAVDMVEMEQAMMVKRMQDVTAIRLAAVPASSGICLKLSQEYEKDVKERVPDFDVPSTRGMREPIVECSVLGEGGERALVCNISNALAHDKAPDGSATSWRKPRWACFRVPVVLQPAKVRLLTRQLCPTRWKSKFRRLLLPVRRRCRLFSLAALGREMCSPHTAKSFPRKHRLGSLVARRSAFDCWLVPGQDTVVKWHFKASPRSPAAKLLTLPACG